MRLRLHLSRKGSLYKTYADFDTVTLNGKDDVINVWQDGKIDSGFKGSLEDLIDTIEFFFESIKKENNIGNRLFTIFYDEESKQFKVRGL